MPPTEGMRTAYANYCKDLKKVGARWNALKTHDLGAVNAQLAALHLEPVNVPAAVTDPPCGK